MQKPLPRQTPRALNPPADVLEPYTFFEAACEHPFEPLDTGLNLRNAWWLGDAALLAYSTEAAVKDAFTKAAIPGDVAHFHGIHSTQAYIMSMPDAIVLAFRGTQVKHFWSSVLDFAVDAQFLPIPDSHGDLIHAGFLGPLLEVWPQAVAHLRAEQVRKQRPLWITGHSLGAALATIAANLCCDDPSMRLQGVYTFGSSARRRLRVRCSHPRTGVQVPQRFRHRAAPSARAAVPSCRRAPVHRRCGAPSPQPHLGDGTAARSRRAPAVGDGSDDATRSHADRRSTGTPGARLSCGPRADQLQRARVELS